MFDIIPSYLVLKGLVSKYFLTLGGTRTGVLAFTIQVQVRNWANFRLGSPTVYFWIKPQESLCWPTAHKERPRLPGRGTFCDKCTGQWWSPYNPDSSLNVPENMLSAAVICLTAKGPVTRRKSRPFSFLRHDWWKCSLLLSRQRFLRQ